MLWLSRIEIWGAPAFHESQYILRILRIFRNGWMDCTDAFHAVLCLYCCVTELSTKRTAPQFFRSRYSNRAVTIIQQKKSAIFTDSWLSSQNYTMFWSKMPKIQSSKFSWGNMQPDSQLFATYGTGLCEFKGSFQQYAPRYAQIRKPKLCFQKK